MSLQLIYGKAGTGKSYWLFEKVQELINSNSKYPIKIITPEQFSFTAERKLLEKAKGNSMLKAEVISFERMTDRILNEVGGKAKVRLSSAGKAMLLSHILITKKNDFSFIGRSEEDVEMITRQITELKKHCVTPENLKNAVNNTENRYLAEKLNDVATLYSLYTETIENNYIDENDGLNLLAQKLEKTEEFKNCDIFIDEFAGFTLQEYEILRILMKISHKVTVIICADNLAENTNPEIDVFYANKQTASRILKLAKEENIEIEVPIQVGKSELNEPNENKRFKTEELKILEENISNPVYEKYEKQVSNLSLFLANNPYSEIENVAINITKLAKQGYRYEDMAVITKNIPQYSSLCKVIFAKYNIPVFIDEKKDLSNNLFVKFVLSLIEVLAQNWSYEAVFGYIKTGFLPLTESEISILENYCIKWGIRGSKWYNKEWNFYEETEEQKQSILQSKNIVVNPILELKKSLQGTKKVKDISKALYDYIINNKITLELEKKINEFKENNMPEKAKEYEKSFKLLIDLLDEIVLVLGEKEITFEKYAKILKMGFAQSDLGVIPQVADQVTVGDVDRSRSHKVKVAFIIGLNDGSFPSSHNEEGFLNDEDRKVLKEKGIELAKGSLEQLYDENFNIYKAFSTAEEKLYISYVSSDADGKSLRPSVLINKIKKIFVNLKEESDVVNRKSEILLKNTTLDELLVNLRNLKEGEEISPIWFAVYEYYLQNEPEKLKNSLKAVDYENIPEKIHKDSLKKLYGGTLKTSVSRLEQYKFCPFSYYLKYGLKLKEKNEFKIEAVDTGTFMHDVIDGFFERLEEMELSVKQLSEAQVTEITEQVVFEKLKLKKYEIFNSIPKFRVLAQRLKNVVVKSMQYIVDSLKNSEFQVAGHEIEFKEGGKYPPMIYTLEDGQKVELTGKIDRMDIAKTPDGNYIRIIDYKSSIKSVNLNEVYAGIKLQLLTYLDSACKEEENALPAGAFYFSLIEPFIKNSKGKTDEELEKELRKQFKMKGLILADGKIVKKMDLGLTSGYSNIVPAYVSKEGVVSSKQNTLTRKQFESLQNYMGKIIKQISKEILDGSIKIEPYYMVRNKKTPCEYCSYKSICQFNQTTKNNYRYISNLQKDEVLEKMESDV